MYQAWVQLLATSKVLCTGRAALHRLQISSFPLSKLTIEARQIPVEGTNIPCPFSLHLKCSPKLMPTDLIPSFNVHVSFDKDLVATHHGQGRGELV